MLLEDFRAVLSKKTGINAGTWRLEGDENGHCACADLSKNFVVMLDNAQHQYDNVGLWTFQRSLPDNIRFVISATYSLGTDVSPVDFKTLPNLTLRDFRLCQEEVDEFIRLSSVRMSAERAGVLLVDPAIHSVIAANCNGHIGALSVSVREIVKRFHHNPTVTVEGIVSFYLSRAMVSHFLRCYSSGVDSLPEQMRACLVKCLTMGPLSITQHESLVVDFRVNATGEPTNVRRHEHRMSVFFKQGDFSCCSVLCGLAQTAERITLVN